MLKEVDDRFDRYYELKRVGYNLENVEDRVCKTYNLSVGDIYSKSREKAKAEARGWAVRELGHSILELARRLGMSQPGVAYAVRSGERTATEKDLALTGLVN
jgi:chromosomal replication initiation ATPase DnaA